MALKTVKLPGVHLRKCNSILSSRNMLRSEKFAEDFLVNFSLPVPLIFTTHRNGYFGNFHDFWELNSALSTVQTPSGVHNGEIKEIVSTGPTMRRHEAYSPRSA
jgi:hypothetical protein